MITQFNSLINIQLVINALVIHKNRFTFTEIPAVEIDFGFMEKIMDSLINSGTFMKTSVIIVFKSTMIMSSISLSVRVIELKLIITVIMRETIVFGYIKIPNLFKPSNGTSYRTLVTIMKLYTNTQIKRNTDVVGTALSINTITGNITMAIVLKYLMEIKSSIFVEMLTVNKKTRIIEPFLFVEDIS